MKACPIIWKKLSIMYLKWFLSIASLPHFTCKAVNLNLTPMSDSFFFHLGCMGLWRGSSYLDQTETSKHLWGKKSAVKGELLYPLKKYSLLIYSTCPKRVLQVTLLKSVLITTNIEQKISQQCQSITKKWAGCVSTRSQLTQMYKKSLTSKFSNLIFVST